MKNIKFTTKVFRFFASDLGRKYVLGGTTTLCIAAFSVHYLPHNLLISKYEKIISSYQNGIEREVSDHMMTKFEKAANLVNLTNAERAVVRPFIVTGFDLYSIGSTKFKNGALVGIPVNFTYTAADEIPRGEIMVKGYEQVDWNSQGGKLLEESLIFTEQEQIFGIAREMLELKTNKVTINSFLAPSGIFMYYTLTNVINHQQRLFARPLSLRLVLYSMVGLFTSGVYCFIKDALQVNRDESIDIELSQLGEEYVKAGIGYYDKVLKKNMAIRHLTGGSQFTAKGNINHYFRTKALPLTMRKSNFEMFYKHLNANKDASSEAL